MATNVVIPFNRRGIFGIKSVGAPTVTTGTDVVFHFEEHPYVQAPYNGILIVNVTNGVPTGTADTLPVYFQTGTNGAKVPATKSNGAPLLGADMEDTGYYIFFFDRGSNVFQVISSVI